MRTVSLVVTSPGSVFIPGFNGDLVGISMHGLPTAGGQALVIVAVGVANSIQSLPANRLLAGSVAEGVVLSQTLNENAQIYIPVKIPIKTTTSLFVDGGTTAVVLMFEVK